MYVIRITGIFQIFIIKHSILEWYPAYGIKITAFYMTLIT